MSNQAKRFVGALKEDDSTAVMRTDVEEFSRRLHYLLLDRKWSQSDLARKVWGETRIDSRGYEQPIGKDRISAYIRGKVMPEPANLKKIAEAFGISPEELAPNLTAAAIEREAPAISLTAIAGNFDKVLLQIRTLVSLATATKIAGLISEDDAARSASRLTSGSLPLSTKITAEDAVSEVEEAPGETAKVLIQTKVPSSKKKAAQE